MKNIFLTYIIFINTVTFLQFAIDKYKAKKSKRRIREKTLLLSAVPFGAFGAYIALHAFNHKKNYYKFSVGLTVMSIIQITSLYVIFTRFL